jgi:bisphosphoglycerate-dependent phosphoglycerate mutase
MVNFGMYDSSVMVYYILLTLYVIRTDVPLSSAGLKEAEEGGKVMKKENYTFDIAFTSLYAFSLVFATCNV